MAVVLTDGEAEDYAEFVAAMRNLPPGIYVVVAVVGCKWGKGPDAILCNHSPTYFPLANITTVGTAYENTVAAYAAVRQVQSRFDIATLGSQSAKDVAAALCGLMHPADPSEQVTSTASALAGDAAISMF